MTLTLWRPLSDATLLTRWHPADPGLEGSQGTTAETDFATQRKDAVRRIKIQMYHTLRSVTAAVMLFTQVVSMVHILLRRHQKIRRLILHGKAQFSSGIQQRVVRIVGSESDATRLAMERHSQHIIPIYDDNSS